MFRLALTQGRNYVASVIPRAKIDETYTNWAMGHVFPGGVAGMGCGFIVGVNIGMNEFKNPYAQAIVTPTMAVCGLAWGGIAGAFAGGIFGALSPVTYPFAAYLILRKR